MAVMRTVIEEKCVSETIDDMSKQFPRLRDMFSGLVWRLSREPERGEKLGLGSPQKYMYKINPPVSDLPTTTILYSYTNDEVNIIDIRLTPKTI